MGFEPSLAAVLSALYMDGKCLRRKKILDFHEKSDFGFSSYFHEKLIKIVRNKFLENTVSYEPYLYIQAALRLPFNSYNSAHQSTGYLSTLDTSTWGGKGVIKAKKEYVTRGK